MGLRIVGYLHIRVDVCVCVCVCGRARAHLCAHRHIHTLHTYDIHNFIHFMCPRVRFVQDRYTMCTHMTRPRINVHIHIHTPPCPRVIGIHRSCTERVTPWLVCHDFVLNSMNWESGSPRRDHVRKKGDSAQTAGCQVLCRCQCHAGVLPTHSLEAVVTTAALPPGLSS